MKKIYFTLAVVVAMFAKANAQEMVIGGDMNDESKWTVTQNVTEENKFSTVTFADGVVTVTAVNGDGNTNTNVTIWQKVNLKAGHRYEFNAHIKGTLPVEAFWCQWYVNAAVPSDGNEYLSESLCFTQVNTWGGCASGYDLDTDLKSWACNNLKTVTVDTDGEYVLACKLGIWASGILDFSVELDDFSLVDLDFVTAVKQTNASTVELFPTSTNKELNIRSSSPIVSATILSVTGQQVLKTNNVDNKIDVSSLKAGIYTVQLVDEKGTKTVMKFIKK